MAFQDRILYERGGAMPVNVRALSPSDPAVLATIARLSALSDHPFRRKLPKIDGNHSSVVLSVNSPAGRILLGADLQVRQSRDYGWLAIVDSHCLAQQDRHVVYKVPHHGSSNADHDDIWKHLVAKNAYSLVAPFVRGMNKLPTDSDRERLRNRTRNAFLTAQPVVGRYRHPDSAVNRSLHEMATKIESVPSHFGHISLRSRQDGEWDLELSTLSKPA